MRYRLIVEQPGLIRGVEENHLPDKIPGSIYLEEIPMAWWIKAFPEKAYHERYYDYQTEKVLQRPAMETTCNKEDVDGSYQMISDGQDMFVLEGLPKPCSVTVSDTDINTDDIVTEVTDGSFGFPTEIAGTYEVKVEAFPHITKVWNVVAS